MKLKNKNLDLHYPYAIKNLVKPFYKEKDKLIKVGYLNMIKKG